MTDPASNLLPATNEDTCGPYFPIYFSGPALEDLTRVDPGLVAQAAGVPIIFDVDYRPYSWPSPEVAAEVLSRAGDASDLIVGNDEEFGFMAGGIDKGFAKAQELAQKPGRIVIYKMGEKGAVTLAGGREIHTGIYPVQAVKPNGAGDSFMAGFLAALSEGQPVADAVLRGSAAAAIVVSRVACAPAMPTPAEVTEFMARSTLRPA